MRLSSSFLPPTPALSLPSCSSPSLALLTLLPVIYRYFACVETQGRTLEQLDAIFSAPNPVKASKRMGTVAVRSDGEVAIVDDA